MTDKGHWKNLVFCFFKGNQDFKGSNMIDHIFEFPIPVISMLIVLSEVQLKWQFRVEQRRYRNRHLISMFIGTLCKSMKPNIQFLCNEDAPYGIYKPWDN